MWAKSNVYTVTVTNSTQQWRSVSDYETETPMTLLLVPAKKWRLSDKIWWASCVLIWKSEHDVCGW